MKPGRMAVTVVLAGVLFSSISCVRAWQDLMQEIQNAKYRETYKGPYERTVKATFQFTIKADGAPPAGDPWHLWQALPRDTMTQKVIAAPQFDVQPTDEFTDPDFGNAIAHWDFSEEKELTVNAEFTLKVNNVLTDVDPNEVGEYDTESDEYKLYTRSERVILINDQIQAIADGIEADCEGADNPYLLAKCAFAWVLDHVVYMYPTANEGYMESILADTIEHNGVTYYRGDCGTYSALYNSILRAMGIPARMAVGGWSLGEDQWHVWSEILIPGYGWIPVDTSAADVYLYDEGAELNALGEKYFGGAPFAPDAEFYFGNIDPYRFVLSIGNDIALEPAPDWDFSEYGQTVYYYEGRAGYMQTPIYHFGLSLEGGIKFEEVEP
jgi:transglutaminase-like putative cysteine protease